MDFLLVEKATEKTVMIREIEGQITEHHPTAMQGTSLPALPPKVKEGGRAIRKKIKKAFDGRPRLDMAYGVAVPWDGRPQSCSWYA